MISILEPPTDFTPFDLAEWLETSILLSRETPLSAAEIEAQFPQNQRPDAAEIEELFAEIRSRADVAPTSYPFRARDEEVFLDPDVDATIYFFLLTLSVEVAPYRTEQRFNEVNPSFELITREAMLGLLGAGAQARRFGWPNGDGRLRTLPMLSSGSQPRWGWRSGSFARTWMTMTRTAESTLPHGGRSLIAGHRSRPF